jgi:hypothetical protein
MLLRAGSGLKLLTENPEALKQDNEGEYKSLSDSADGIFAVWKTKEAEAVQSEQAGDYAQGDEIERDATAAGNTANELRGHTDAMRRRRPVGRKARRTCCPVADRNSTDVPFPVR